MDPVYVGVGRGELEFRFLLWPTPVAPVTPSKHGPQFRAISDSSRQTDGRGHPVSGSPHCRVSQTIMMLRRRREQFHTVSPALEGIRENYYALGQAVPFVQGLSPLLNHP